MYARGLEHSHDPLTVDVVQRPVGQRTQTGMLIVPGVKEKQCILPKRHTKQSERRHVFLA